MRTQDKAILDSALEYAQKGLPVFPVHHPTEAGCSCRKKGCTQVGKHPAVPNGFKDSTLDVQQITNWFEGKYRGYNLAVLCGVGHLCLDVDPKNGGLEAFEELIQDHTQLPDTWVEETGEAKSGERGRHYWFTIPNALKGESVLTRKPLPGYLGVDLLAANQYAIVAPSRHVSGVQYDTLIDLEDVTESPDWLLALTRVSEEEDFSFQTSDGTTFPSLIRPGPEIRGFLRHGDVPAGAQQPMIVKTARALWGLWYTVDEATEAIWAALQKCDWDEQPWERSQVSYHVAHTFNSAPKDMQFEAELPFTDWGNALRLVQTARGNLKFCPQANTWYHFDSTSWQEDNSRLVDRMITMMCLQEVQRAAFIEDPERASPIRKNANSLQGSRTARNVIYKAEADESFVVNASEFDTHKYLLNCANLTVDLKTGEGREQSREDLITHSTRAAYYPGKKSELWEETVSVALGGDKSLVDYLQMAFGQGLFGVAHEHAFYYLHGPGGTGKTTVLEAVIHTLGSYGGVADPESFMQSPSANPGGTRADLASLRGKRFVISTEIQQGARFSTSAVNRLTGSDTIAVRTPYARSMLVFKPEWTLFFAANHFPSVSASRRDGFWRRVKVIPFEHQLTREEMNPVLPHLLAQRDHMEGVLTWLIEGAVKWWTQYGAEALPMVTPQEIVAQVERQQEEADPLLAFYDHLVFDDGLTTSKHDLHDYYLGWCDQEGVRMPWTSQKLSMHLKGALGLKDALRDRTWCWLGISIPLIKGK